MINMGNDKISWIEKACLFYYEIDKNKEIQIQEELEIRRNNNNHYKQQLLRA